MAKQAVNGQNSIEKVKLHKRSFNFTPDQIRSLEEARRWFSHVLGVQLTLTDALHMCVRTAVDKANRVWQGKAEQDGD